MFGFTTSKDRKHVAPFIYEEQDYKSLHFAIHELQSKMCISQPNALIVDYTRTMMGFLLLKHQPRHIVMIGLGGGSLAKYCYEHLPESRITVVEINPHVIALRKDFMIPDDDARFRIIQADGAEFVRESPADIDVLLVDGFDHKGQPAQLSSRRFYEACKSILSNEGVMVVNLDEASFLHKIYLARIAEIFSGNIAAVAANGDGNVIAFASPRIAINAAELRRKLKSFRPTLNQRNGHHA